MIEPKPEINSQTQKKSGRSLFSPEDGNFAIAAIFSTTVGLFISLAFVIKYVAKQPANANNVTSQTAPLTADYIDNIVKHNPNSKPSQSNRLLTKNLFNHTGIKKQQAIVEEIPATDGGSNGGLEEIPPTPLKKGGFESPSAAPSAAPSVANPSSVAPSAKKDSQILELTSNDAIILSLQNNREIKNAYLQRIIERQDLAIAEDKFTPNFTPSVELVYNRNQLGAIATNEGNLNLGANLVVTIPTGATISATWAGRRQAQNTLDSGTIVEPNSLGQNISLNFTQPLLRGFGTDINRASIEIVRLNEQANILNLKNTLINNITITLQAYRSLLQAQEALKIEEIALTSVQRQLESIDALIEAGRRARIERIQAETNLANRQLSLLAASNQLEAARLDLISILDIDKNIQVVAIEQPAIDDRELVSWNRESALSISLENNIDYLQSLIDIQRAKLDLLLAENEQKWDLNLQASYTNNLNNNTENSNDLRAGVSLSRTFGDRSLESEVDRSKIQLEIVQNQLEEQREELEIRVINSLRDVEFNLQQVQQAQRSRELSEQQLKNEQDKFKLGVADTRLIDVLDFEQDLVNAKNQELNATINYLNALTDLYSTLGITLDQWHITIEPEN